MPEISKQEALEYAGMDGQEVDEFKQWKEKNLFKLIDIALPSHDPPFNEYEDFARMIWQEATKQRDAQYGSMAEHTELSIREDAIIGERGRIVADIRKVADKASCWYGNKLRELADRIEKENDGWI